MTKLTNAAKASAAYDIWSATYDQDRPPHTYLEESALIALVQADDKDVVLDAACGTGRYAKVFADRGSIVFGCDVSEKMISVARAKVPSGRFDVVDLDGPLPYSDQRFSRIVCSLSIRHLENLDGFLSEVYRLLRPGGRFVFSTIHTEMDWSTYERAKPPPIDVNLVTSAFPYSRDWLEQAAERAGLKMEAVQELCADERVRPWLTVESYHAQVGKKFVMIYSTVRLQPK